MTIVSGKVSDMYEADACILQASAFFRCRKITDANVLNGFFKRLETYPEMKTERFTAVKRSVFLYEYHRICVRRSFMLHCSEIRMKQFRSSRRLFAQRELLGEYMICLFYAVFRPISQGILFTT